MITSVVAHGSVILAASNDNKLLQIEDDSFVRELTFDRPPLVVASADGSVWILRLNAAGTKHVVEQVDDNSFTVSASHELATDGFLSLGVSKSNGRLWLGGRNGKVTILDPANGFAEV
jgi:streptogramin lyase